VTGANAGQLPRGELRAWGWVGHLRRGGTTPWASWRGEGEVLGRSIPGAQQLELLRRANRTGRLSSAMADRVLSASAVGRGSPDLNLVGVIADSGFGPPPVDPGGLTAHELLRVAWGLLAEDLAAAPVTPGPRPARPRRRSQRLRPVGDPRLSVVLRDGAAGRGRGFGGRRPAVVVMGTSLDVMLADVWSHRCFGSPVPQWEEWLARLENADVLPPRVDLASIASTWAARVGADRVHVVLDSRALPRLLKVPVPAPPAPESAAGAELARRVATVLGLLVTPEVRSQLLHDVLRPRLVEHPGPPPAIPAERRGWVLDRSRQLREELVRGHYPVHGEVEAVVMDVREPELSVTRPPEDEVLQLAIALLVQGAQGRKTPGEEMGH
jgi:hypothetical protein